MKKYKILLPIAYGGRVEAGSVMALPDDVASAYGPEYVVPADAHDTVDVETEVKNLADMTLVELREEAKTLELATGGSKTDLIERITLHRESQSEEEEGEEGEDDESEDDSK